MPIDRRGATRCRIWREDVKRQTGVTEPLRDWFPLSASSAISDVTDLLQGPGADWGTLKCGCHPDCGIGTAFMVSKTTKEWAPRLELHQRRAVSRRRARSSRMRPAVRSSPSCRPALACSATTRQAACPKGFSLKELLHKVRQAERRATGRTARPRRKDAIAKRDEWLMLFVAGMWFQDLWTYDFRRTEMCIIPYATQMGEISFCAYNTGVGWRQIVEKMHQNATVAEWYRAHGKHAVYANPRKSVPLPAGVTPVSLKIPRDGELVDWKADRAAPARTDTLVAVHLIDAIAGGVLEPTVASEPRRSPRLRGVRS